ncbi:MAG: cytochrome bc complex cytochrome b subunit [Chloroflexi bacterium]|nr:cytochrome bc complex cytochrome b subunit [Chloroflexota bacterium]
MGEESKTNKTFRQRVYDRVYETMTAIAAGMSPRDIRDMLRGKPAGRPNPRYRVHSTSFWFHMKPRWYNKSTTRITYTLALGWISTFLAVVLGLTGIILMIFYTPSTDAAYFDMLNIIGGIPFGELVRDIHRLAAELMVACVILHLVRVFATGSYKQPRSFNWLVGMVLLFITLIFSYSGYLLPWDQIAYWAITIGTSAADAVPVIGAQIQMLMLGGPEVGQLGLLRFYTLHVIILPVALAVAFGVHYYKVVKQGISLPPAVEAKKKKDERVPYLPGILVREVAWVMLGLLVLIIPVVTFYNGPLEDHADPFVTPLHATAPWYFLWLQGLIKLPDVFGGIVEGKFVYGVIIPGIFFTILFALPYIDRNPARRWQDRKLALGLGAAVIVALTVLTWMGTPAYRLETPPAEEIALEFVPTDRHGEINELGWDNLVDGVYEISIGETAPTEPVASIDLDQFITKLASAMTHESDRLPDGTATLTIATWQQDLKRIDLDIAWEEDGMEHTFNQYTYIHKNTIHQE